MSLRARISSFLRSLPWPVLAVAAALAASLVWAGLAFATGLIFHVMPAGPPLAAAGAVGWAATRISWRRRLATAVIGFGVSLVTVLALALSGRPLDIPALTILPAVVGFLLALFLLTWFGR